MSTLRYTPALRVMRVARQLLPRAAVARLRYRHAAI